MFGRATQYACLIGREKYGEKNQKNIEIVKNSE